MAENVAAAAGVINPDYGARLDSAESKSYTLRGQLKEGKLASGTLFDHLQNNRLRMLAAELYVAAQTSGRGRSVECDGVRFDSTGAAAKHFGLNRATVRASIRRGGSTAGRRFLYVDEPARRISNGRHRAVHCVTTDEHFESITAASIAHGIPITTIQTAMSANRPARGRLYVYET